MLELFHDLGDLDSLFETANALAGQGFAWIEKVLWGKDFRDVRKDPRFEELVRRRGMLDYWREHGWPDECSAAGDGIRCDYSEHEPRRGGDNEPSYAADLSATLVPRSWPALVHSSPGPLERRF